MSEKGRYVAAQAGPTTRPLIPAIVIMLVDDAKVVVGSLALAALSLDFRREVAIVADEPSAVADAVGMFRKLTAAAAEAGTLPAGAVDGTQW